MKKGTITFCAAFAPGRKCLQVDTDGEALIQLVVPDTDAEKLQTVKDVYDYIEGRLK